MNSLEELLKKIMIIDDEPYLVEILSFLFEKDGWEVLGLKNGQEALNNVESFRPAVILSDINMPVINGLELLEELKNRNLNIPLILLTGYRDEEKMKRAWASCVYDFLDKPFVPEEVLKAANSAEEFGEEYVRLARKRFERMGLKKGA